MKSLYLLPALLLSACATVAPPPPDSGRFFADGLFLPPAKPVDRSAVLAMSPEMQAFVDRSIGGPMRNKGIQQALVDALYDKKQLKLEYDDAITRSASEAFDARAGNCLSLVLMTASIAKRLGLPLIYQQVSVPNSWTRSNDIAFASEHVNLVMGLYRRDPSVLHNEHSSITVDFLPPEQTQGQRARVITEQTIIAMYFNNRAAESLAASELDEAYWWARAAILESPTFLTAYNTLSVVYLRRREPQLAEHILSEVLAREPANTMAMTNLSVALDDQGRSADAQQLRSELATIEPTPPFYYFDLGMQALKVGDYATAKNLFRREIRRDAYSHEFHFWLAIAEKNLGDTRGARAELKQAIENSTTAYHRDIYTAKLDYINTHAVQ